jgi:ATP-dependent helicase/nuclease subunit B
MESTITAAELETVALDDMLARLDEQALVLTVNKRLAAWLHRRHADLQAADVWETPHILAWNGWLLSLHDQLLTTGRETARLLTNHQESLIWEKIADGWNHAQGREALLRPAAAAAAAADAWKLLHGWRIDPRELTSYPSPESRLLANWFDEFKLLCAQNGWLSAAELPALILKNIDEQAVPLPLNLFLAGFDELTPGQEHLLAHMAAAGCRIAQIDNARPEAAATRCCCHDNRDEIRRAAYWARDRLQANPQYRIGIVIPQLARLRKDVERHFHAALHPEALTAASHSVSDIFNISLGTPLADEPMVQDALLFLDLLRSQKMSLGQIGQLLRSRFLGDYETEWACRSLLDRRLRETEPPEMTTGRLLQVLSTGAGSNAARCPDLGKRLEKTISLQHQKEHAPEDRAAEIAALLETAGWPGKRSLDSREYQCRQHLIGLLEDLAHLDPIGKGMSFSDAVLHLRKLARQTLFQPQGNSDAPIQISGPLEAAGQDFDALWVMNMDDDNWPSRADPNPLLPPGLQRAHGLPHTSGEREMLYAATLTQRMLQSAPEVIFSFPAMDGERELRPSPLISHYPLIEQETGETDFARSMLGSAPVETVNCNTAPPVTSDDIPRGGSGLISDQAACPFRAFANYRLGTRKLEEAELGFDARVRGTLMHRCLELFWNEVRSSDELASLGEEGRRTLVSECIDQAFGENRRDPGLEQGYLELERSRLQRLLTRWLETIELQRAPFTVAGLEEDIELELEGLELKLRADRIDTLEDGRQIVIDYKSGRPFTPDWESERLGEPQLPLYTLSNNRQTAGALLAFINGRETRFSGLVEEKSLVPGNNSLLYKGDWDALLTQWKTSLHALAAEVMQGYAAIDPVDPARSCRYCGLQSLCRIDESESGFQLEENDDS